MALDGRHRFLIAKVGRVTAVATTDLGHDPHHRINNTHCCHCCRCLTLQLVEAYGLDEVVVERKLR
jgi:hypothetical protein